MAFTDTNFDSLTRKYDFDQLNLDPRYNCFEDALNDQGDLMELSPESIDQLGTQPQRQPHDHTEDPLGDQGDLMELSQESIEQLGIQFVDLENYEEVFDEVSRLRYTPPAKPLSDSTADPQAEQANDPASFAQVISQEAREDARIKPEATKAQGNTSDEDMEKTSDLARVFQKSGQGITFSEQIKISLKDQEGLTQE